MKSKLSLLDYVFFVVSLLLCAAAGIYYLVKEKHKKRKDKKKTQETAEDSKVKENLLEQNGDEEENTNDYFLGGRKMSLFPVACSMFASNYSAIFMLGLPAEIYTTGSVFMFGNLVYIPATIFVALVFIPIYYNNKFSSIFEYIEQRYQSELLRKVTALGSACCGVCSNQSTTVAIFLFNFNFFCRLLIQGFVPTFRARCFHQQPVLQNGKQSA